MQLRRGGYFRYSFITGNIRVETTVLVPKKDIMSLKAMLKSGSQVRRAASENTAHVEPPRS